MLILEYAYIIFFHNHIKPESKTKLVLAIFQTKLEATPAITPQAQTTRKKPKTLTPSSLKFPNT